VNKHKTEKTMSDERSVMSTWRAVHN